MNKSEPNDVELQNIISDAYDVFRVPKPTDDGVCDCCVSKEIKTSFFKFTPNELPLNYLREWFGGAADREIDQNLWRWLLPRVLEFLVKKQEISCFGIEVTLRRFPTGDSQRWSPKEWSILERFRIAFIESQKVRKSVEALESSGGLNEPLLDDVLCMFALAGWSPSDIFSQIFTWSDEELVERFWHDWCSWTMSPSVWITSFWDDPSVPSCAYRNPELKERISRFALNAPLRSEQVLAAISKLDSENRLKV